MVCSPTVHSSTWPCHRRLAAPPRRHALPQASSHGIAACIAGMRTWTRTWRRLPRWRPAKHSPPQSAKQAGAWRARGAGSTICLPRRQTARIAATRDCGRPKRHASEQTPKRLGNQRRGGWQQPCPQPVRGSRWSKRHRQRKRQGHRSRHRLRPCQRQQRHGQTHCWALLFSL